MEVDKMRAISIADFLNAMGIHPSKQRGKVLWYSAPYRMERRPSFKLDINRNVWFDFGIGKGGDIFDLAGEFIGSEDFLLRAAFIARNGAYPLPIIEHPQRNEEKEPVFNDIWVRPLQDTRLLGYLEERGINAHVAIPNCEEVRYRVRGKRYYAIGFRNMSEGLELRNRIFKGCIPPKDISLKRNGSDVCSVFEGFMDYLSAMQLGIIASDWLVLNSVSNVEKAVKALQVYERIECFLDNDDAGRRTFQRLHDCFGERVIDRSSLYADHKDLNEFLLSKNVGNNV
ncbi:Toprim domain-containing protein [Bacteroides heparinolyticus]|uniref:Toprim domain-containing protein n=1 Tax=Prevotella heparinolytica TaxID=28113 RepID=A0A4V2SE84_9BACE|nr:toprim domain-containing protein [Bacteroides heparinolyticus]TCO87909.1 Toprim domain-containing protein [Bacteroides heparinolyticus]